MQYAEALEDHAPILLSADPDGLALERQTGALLVADQTGAITRVGDRAQTVATLGRRIGGFAVAPGGSIYATCLGVGAGAVVEVANGNVAAIPRLSPELWRLGISYDADAHVLYTTQFAKSVNGPCNGAIVEIDLEDGHASTIADGFVKPVGVVRLAGWLIITDARQRAVFRVKLRWGRAVSTSVLAGGIDRPDSICIAGPDSVLVSCFDEETKIGTVRQMWLDGRVRQVARGAWEPRGIASDGDRVYVSARRASRVLVFDL